MKLVLDTSAVLALILGEPGADIVEATLDSASMATVNASEAMSKMCDRGFSIENARYILGKLPIILVPFDLDLAVSAAALRPATRDLHFSFADRACLALAKRDGAPAVTGDRAWQKVDLGVEVRVIR